jgi:hypothetical protein
LRVPSEAVVSRTTVGPRISATLASFSRSGREMSVIAPTSSVSR